MIYIYIYILVYKKLKIFYPKDLINKIKTTIN